MATFEEAFKFVQKWEGGPKVTNDPRDPGGLTKWGISKRANPDLDIEALSEEQAKAIYKERYWDKVGGSAQHPAVALVAFDTAVNMGVSRANEWLAMCQHSGDPRVTCMAIIAMREARYRSNKLFSVFGKGWLNRLTDLKREVGAILPSPQ